MYRSVNSVLTIARMRCDRFVSAGFSLILTTAAFATLALPLGSAHACPVTDTALAFGEAQTRQLKSADAHPLLARVVRTAGAWKPQELSTPTCQRYTELSEFLRAVAFAFDTEDTILVLGEIHDSLAHHQFRAAIIDFLGDPPVGKGAIVFEQFRSDQQAALDAFNQSPGSLADLKQRTDWSKSNWPDIYDPLFAAVIKAKLPIYAGDVARADIRNVAKQGPEALKVEQRKSLALDVPLGEKNDAASAIEIKEAHCGMLPDKAIPNMAFAQRYRDAHLADATLKAAEKHGSAVLIAGNGHARTDRGVPWYIRQRAPDKKIISVMLIEVEEGKTDPEAYIPRDPDGKPAADYIIFTPAQDRGDPCEGMKAMGKK